MSRRLKNLLIGAGKIFDFTGSGRVEAFRAVQARKAFVSRRSPEEALGKDCAKIGLDMRQALAKARAEHGNT